MVTVFAGGPDPQAQRRPQSGPVTFAIFVTDPAGAPVGGVSVSVEGPVKRQATTEAGRIALENLPTGSYHFTFAREGFYVSEKDVNAPGTAPIDLKVTLTPAPHPAPPRREGHVDAAPKARARAAAAAARSSLRRDLESVDPRSPERHREELRRA